MNIVYGVGLLLFEPTGKLLVLQELQDKPHFNKKAGMLSPPLETIKEGETTSKALQRLMYEEIGEILTVAPVFFADLLIKLTNEYAVQLYMHHSSTPEVFISQPNDRDIKHFGWMSPEELLEVDAEKRRLEIEPIIQSYLNLA